MLHKHFQYDNVIFAMTTLLCIYQVHRGLMVVAGLMVLSAAVIIIVQVGGFRSVGLHYSYNSYN